MASIRQRAEVPRDIDSVLLEEIWRLHHAVRIGDGFYLAVAKALRVPLLTADTRLSRAPVTDVSITLIR